MAYRLEKERSGGEAIVIDGWEQGIAPDPYSGLNYLLATDIETPGEVAAGYGITTNATSGATLGDPIADSTRFFTYGTPGIPSGSPQSFAILDDDGHVFESTTITGTYTYLSSNSTLTSASNLDGIQHWLGYLFKTRGVNIDYWNGSIWVNAWSTALTSGVKHYMYVGTDNVLYITNGNYLASVTASVPNSFDPTSGGTFTISATKLRLPVTDQCISLAEVGTGSSGRSTLLIGGLFNAIYPWDKTSVSFGLPIYVADAYIKLMVSANQNVFIFPGNQQGRGRIYITNGSQADLYFKIPDYIFGEQDPYYAWGDAIFHRNNLIFGFFPTKNSGSGIIQNFGYVWAIKLDDSKAFRAVSALPTSVSFVSNATCLISTSNLSSPGFGFIAAWTDNSSSPGIGYSGTTVGIGTGAILTDLIPIGTFLNKTTNYQIEFKLRSALQSGESISISPVVDGSVLSPLTFNPTVTTGSISGYASVNFQKAQWLQFIIGVTGNSATSGARFKELRIR